MRQKRDVKLFLQDIADSIELVHRYVEGMDFENFCDDSRTQDSVIRRLSVIGEAASNLPLEVTEKYSDISWGDIIGMRNFLIHDYAEVSLKRVWETIEQGLPVLKTQIEKITKDLT